MARKQKALAVVAKPHPKASILAPAVTPALLNSGNSDQTCGGCGVVLIQGDTPTNWAAPFQMLLRCPKCGAHNEIPAKILGG